MDYIYNLLCDELSSRDKTSKAYANIQEVIYLYLMRVIASEFWWRLKCQGKKELIKQIYNAKNAGDMIHKLKDVSGSALLRSDDLEYYLTLIDKVDTCRKLRNESSHHNGYQLTGNDQRRVDECHNVLLDISQNLLNNPVFPFGQGSKWMPLIPVSRQNDTGMITCMRYEERRNDLRGTIQYDWVECTLPDNTREFARGELKSHSSLQEGRLYFYQAPPAGVIGGSPQISCAYPFVQVKLAENRRSLKKIWLFESVETRLNGACLGTDLLSSDPSIKRDIEYIPELATAHQQDPQNPYLMTPELKYNRAYPIRNIFKNNFSNWRDNASADAAMTKVFHHLENKVSTVYVYGSGGIGKTATIQRLLDTKYYKTGNNRPIFDYLIFLSAKKRQWRENRGVTPIAYQNGYQVFDDLPSLSVALRNIFAHAGSPGSEPADLDPDWFTGKNILMVLDDFESIDAADQTAIRESLEKNFADSTGEKRRQVIITCRTNPAEGYAANVELANLSEPDTASFALFCAGHMGGGREASYLQALGNSRNTGDLTVNQIEKRQTLQRLTSGLPLVVSAIVFSDKEAVISPGSRTDLHLSDYLYKDTYQYLGSKELRKLAYISVRLTNGTELCTVERLQFVWNYDEHDTSHKIDSMLQRLCNYRVLAMDKDGRNFTFSGEMMRSYIEDGFKQDKDHQDILSEKSQKIADWLCLRQEHSIADCLLLNLQDVVHKWYLLHNQEDRYLHRLHGRADTLTEDVTPDSDLITTALIDDMVMLYEVLRKAPSAEPHHLRSAVHLLLQVYCDHPSEANELYSQILSGLISDEDYYTETIRCLIVTYGKTKSYENLQKVLLDNLRKVKKKYMRSRKNYLLILWNTMLLFQDMNAHKIPLIPELTVHFNEASADCPHWFTGFSLQDSIAFREQLNTTIQLLYKGDPKSRETIKHLEYRYMDMKYMIDSCSDQVPHRLFFG